MPGAELDESRVRSDASTLHLGGGGEILGADEVRGGLLLPGDLAGWLRERREGLTREPVSACSVVTSSQSWRKNSRTMSGSTPTVPSSLGSSHGAGSEPTRSAWDCPASGITEVTYSSWVTRSSAPASVMITPP